MPKVPVDSEEIVSEGGIGNFAMIPDFVWGLNLSSEAKLLYCYYKSIVHETPGRTCYQRSTLIRQKTGIGKNKLPSVKKELEVAGLIRIEPTPNGNLRGTDKIYILNVWSRNAETFEAPVTPESGGRVSVPVTPKSGGEVIVKILKTEAKVRTTPFTGKKVNGGDTHSTVMKALGNVMHLDLELNAGRLGKLAKQVRSAGYTAEQVQAWFGGGGWWYKEHWKGKRGENPNQADITNSLLLAKRQTERNSVAIEYK